MRVFRMTAGAVVVLAAALVVLVSSVQGGGVQSQSGRYLEFSGPGSGYVEVPHDPALNPTDEITIDLWVNLESTEAYGADAGPGDECPSLVGKGFETAYWLGIACGTQQLRFYAQGGGSVDGTGDVPLGEWAHVAVTYDGTNVRFYINGALDSTLPVGGPMTTNTEPVRIGNDVDWDQSPKGMLDDVRIWDVAASDAEVASLMNRKIDAPTPGLVGAWNFDGAAAADVGGWGGALSGDVQISGTAEPEPVERLWGDTNCRDGVNPVDSLGLLRADAGLAVSQESGCPGVGDTVTVTDGS